MDNILKDTYVQIEQIEYIITIIFELDFKLQVRGKIKKL